MAVRVIRGSPPGLLALAGAAIADAPDGRTNVSVLPLPPALHALVRRPATLSSGPVLVDSMPCAPFPCGPRPPMKADISTLRKPDILTLQRQQAGVLLTRLSHGIRLRALGFASSSL